jgi:anti-sigma B factor antagonist
MSDSLHEDPAGSDGVSRLSGDLTIQSAAIQCQLMRDWIDGGVLAIDLSDVQACDSSGVQLLVAARRSVAARGQSLALQRASPAVREVFGRYGLDGLLACGTPD